MVRSYSEPPETNQPPSLSSTNEQILPRKTYHRLPPEVFSWVRIKVVLSLNIEIHLSGKMNEGGWEIQVVYASEL